MGGDHWALYRVDTQDNSPLALSLVTEHGRFEGRGKRLVHFMHENQDAFSQSALHSAMTQQRTTYMEDTQILGFRLPDDYGGEPVRSSFVIPLGDDGTGRVGLLGVYWGRVHGWGAFGLSARPWDALRRVAAEWWSDMHTNEASMSDPLTGLLNRRGVSERWDLTVRRGEAMILAVIDLDHFGEVNNRWGHLLGDSVLRTLGKILFCVARNHGGWCGRWGGDEFVLCLDARSDWLQVGAEIQQTLDQAGQRAGWPQGVTLSGGAQRWIAGAGDWSETFDEADRALYRAKKRGRARFVFASRASRERRRAQS
jgi:diguanylate cyclase (GGDEF)-like protein